MYHQFQTSTVDPLDHAAVERRYEDGYVFTRLGNTIMHQVRSVRVPLHAFHASSENRRAVKAVGALTLHYIARDAFIYHWNIGKMAKDFYARFGAGTFSANKIKELFTSPQSVMNAVFEYRDAQAMPVGYCLCHETPALLHYAYPFYGSARASSIGMAMMVHAVVWAKEQKKEYIYLGSIQGTQSLYKFQFKGIEWFDGERWRRGKPKFLIPNS